MLTSFLIFIPAGYLLYTMLKPTEKHCKTEESFREITIRHVHVLGKHEHD